MGWGPAHAVCRTRRRRPQGQERNPPAGGSASPSHTIVASPAARSRAATSPLRSGCAGASSVHRAGSCAPTRQCAAATSCSSPGCTCAATQALRPSSAAQEGGGGGGAGPAVPAQQHAQHAPFMNGMKVARRVWPTRVPWSIHHSPALAHLGAARRCRRGWAATGATRRRRAPPRASGRCSNRASGSLTRQPRGTGPRPACQGFGGVGSEGAAAWGLWETEAAATRRVAGAGKGERGRWSGQVGWGCGGLQEPRGP
jgi:hypothetical protein